MPELGMYGSVRVAPWRPLLSYGQPRHPGGPFARPNRQDFCMPLALMTAGAAVGKNRLARIHECLLRLSRRLVGLSGDVLHWVLSILHLPKPVHLVRDLGPTCCDTHQRSRTLNCVCGF
jgi:hypothetical protein